MTGVSEFVGVFAEFCEGLEGDKGFNVIFFYLLLFKSW